MNNPSIEEVRKEHKALEDEIERLITEFTKNTSLTVMRVSVDRLLAWTMSGKHEDTLYRVRVEAGID
jgi:hypothetical protein